ncbi:MAG: hypothetical protein PHC50_00810 [Candidatus Cloacimonetes bacterium]|nr:hypothetical protein [Candidatus Cloacimonadota bacterium]
MKKLIFLILLSCLTMMLLADDSSDWLWEDDGGEAAETPMQVSQELIELDFAQKDARRAMLYSMILPGAGQFYGDRSAFTTYLFPVIELGLIAGNIIYRNQGEKKTRKFEKYATGEDIAYTLGDGTVITTRRYDRQRQNRVQNLMIELDSNDIYDSGYFRLDDTNTQHFYEDIGKYKHYVFGWADWYYHFATDEAGNPQDPVWYPQPDGNNPGWVWDANYPLWNDPELDFSTVNFVRNNTHASSLMRQKYVEMRNDAKDDYYTAHYFIMGLAFNHVAAGLDAIRVTRNANKGRSAQLHYNTAIWENNLTPILSFSWDF